MHSYLPFSGPPLPAFLLTFSVRPTFPGFSLPRACSFWDLVPHSWAGIPAFYVCISGDIPGSGALGGLEGLHILGFPHLGTFLWEVGFLDLLPLL